MLNVDDNVREVMTGGGLLAAMRPGSALVGTVDVLTSRSGSPTVPA